MKRILLCIMALLLIACTAWAQRGLNCYPVFRGKVVPAKRMVVTEVRGGSMATYKLDYYHSVQFQVDEATAMKVAELILGEGIRGGTSHLCSGSAQTLCKGAPLPLLSSQAGWSRLDHYHPLSGRQRHP